MNTVEKVVEWLNQRVIETTMAAEKEEPFPKVRIIHVTRKGLFLAVYQQDGEPLTYRIDVKAWDDETGKYPKED